MNDKFRSLDPERLRTVLLPLAPGLRGLAQTMGLPISSGNLGLEGQLGQEDSGGDEEEADGGGGRRRRGFGGRARYGKQSQCRAVVSKETQE